MYGHGKLDVAAAVNAVKGSNNGCLTAAGDANGSTTVNVLDVVAVVNHILGISTLSAEAQACADITGEGTVNSSDIPGIIDIILAGAPRLAARVSEPEVATWTQSTRGDAVHIEVAGAPSHSLEMVFNLPRGYRMEGDPVLRGAASDITVAWNENLKAVQSRRLRSLGLRASPARASLCPSRSRWCASTTKRNSGPLRWNGCF